MYSLITFLRFLNKQHNLITEDYNNRKNYRIPFSTDENLSSKKGRYFLNEISQYLIIAGTIAIIITAIWALRRQHINMRSHHKIQAIALTGLTLVAIVALIASLSFKDNSFVAVASAAVGGIAIFISHRTTLPNKTILFPLEDTEAEVNKPLEFTVAVLVLQVLI